MSCKALEGWHTAFHEARSLDTWGHISKALGGASAWDCKVTVFMSPSWVCIPSRITSSIRLKSTLPIPSFCRLPFLLVSQPLNIRSLHSIFAMARFTAYSPCFDLAVFTGCEDCLCLVGQAVRWVDFPPWANGG